MKVPCIKVVSESFNRTDFELRSYDKDSVLSRVYRNVDGAFNVVEKALAFSYPEDVVGFINEYFLDLSIQQIWIASADSIEPRNWMFNINVIKDNLCVGDDLWTSFIESADKAEFPDLTELKMYIREKKTDPPCLTFVAPRGTVLATNLVLHERVPLPSTAYSKSEREEAVKAITKKLDMLEL